MSFLHPAQEKIYAAHEGFKTTEKTQLRFGSDVFDVLILPAVAFPHLTLVGVELGVGSTDHLLGVFGTLCVAVLGGLAVRLRGDNDSLAASLAKELTFGSAKKGKHE